MKVKITATGLMENVLIDRAILIDPVEVRLSFSLDGGLSSILRTTADIMDDTRVTGTKVTIRGLSESPCRTNGSTSPAKARADW